MSEQTSLYLQSELYERIALAQQAYDIADEHRYEGRNDFLYGYEGSQFCRCLAEFLEEITDEGFDEIIRFDTSTTLYQVANEHYPSFAPLLDAEDICIVDE